MTHVIIKRTYYYINGPYQGRPPDGTFAEGTQVEMLNEQTACSQVKSEEGITAWVKTADLELI
jgi:hypothetical protein